MSVVFITGGASGIGAASVKKFLADGYRVAFMDCNVTAAQTLLDECDSDDLLFIQGDVSCVSDIEAAVKTTHERFGRLDTVVANAGIYLHKNILAMDEAEWDEVIATNLKGVAFTVRAALPYLIEQQSGSIILVASDQALIAKGDSFAYAASKGAVAQMAKSLAVDYGKYNIRSNAVCPGTIKTAMTESIMREWAAREFNGNVDALWETIKQEFPLQRIGEPEEVAELIAFLASDSASFINGSVYSIDGGSTAT